MLTVNELFSGLGSQKTALNNLGIKCKVVGISEIDKSVLRSYELLHGPYRNYGDIREVDKLDYADIWTYSFPCQSISLAGRTEGFKKGSKTKSSVLWEVERLLHKASEHKELPKYLVMENVKNLVGKNFIADFNSWLEILDTLGYNSYWKILNAKHYGIAQNRERVIAVSIRKDIDLRGFFDFGGDKPLIKRMKDYLEQGFEGSEENFPSNIIREPGSAGIIQYDIAQKVKVRVFEVNIPELVALLKKARKESGVSKQELAEKLGQPLTLVEHWFRADKYNSIPATEVWYKLKDLIGITTSEFDECVMTFEVRDGKYDQTNRVYDIEGIAPTLTTMCADLRITDGDKIRNLTVREAWRLMGFSDNQIDKVIGEVTEAQLYKQAGNSIAVPVLEAVFEEIVNLESKSLEGEIA